MQYKVCLEKSNNERLVIEVNLEDKIEEYVFTDLKIEDELDENGEGVLSYGLSVQGIDKVTEEQEAISKHVIEDILIKAVEHFKDAEEA